LITIKEAVEKILLDDEIALEGLRNEILNLSAYAKKKQNDVEKYCKKPVKIGTIVINIMRFAKKLKDIPTLRPYVKLQDINIKSPIHEITFELTKEALQDLIDLKLQIKDPRTFFTLTQGSDEITILFSEELNSEIKDKFKNIKVEIQDLVAITVRFSDQYIDEPNVIYSLISSLALKRINLVEIVSTYTQITFIVNKEEMSKSIEILNTFLM
jgi:aspartokinase